MTLTQDRRQLWLIRHLHKSHGVMVDAGITTFEQRRENTRAAILKLRLEHCAINAKDGRTYSEIFEHSFGQKLEPDMFTEAA